MCPFSLSLALASRCHCLGSSLLLLPWLGNGWTTQATNDVTSHRPLRSYILCRTAFWSMKNLPLAFYMHCRHLRCTSSIFMSVQLRWLDLLIQKVAINEQHREAAVNSRSIFVTAVEDQERIRFPEEVLLIQLIATKLQHHRLLEGKQGRN